MCMLASEKGIEGVCWQVGEDREGVCAGNWEGVCVLAGGRR